jgi:AhpD family alkylhydroperoxidase
MPRIAPVVSPDTGSKVAVTLSQVKANLGTVPDLFATLANAPAALDGYMALSKALSRGRLSALQREILALTIAQENRCRYCLSAHTALSAAVGLSAADAVKARFGENDDPFERALTAFCERHRSSARFCFRSRYRHRPEGWDR